MKMTRQSALALLNRWTLKGWMVCGVVLLSFAAGMLVTPSLARANQPKADDNRVFELLIYHTLPGKEPALESIFRDVSKMQTAHNLDIVGYWVPDEDPAWANTFIYLVAHPSREDANKNWKALHNDPAFPQYRERAKPLIEMVDKKYRVDEVYMRPAEFSAMK